MNDYNSFNADNSSDGSKTMPRRSRYDSFKTKARPR